MTQLTVTTDLQRIATGLESFETRKTALTELAESAKGLSINGVDDKSGYKAVRAKRIELRNAEIEIEKEGKAMRDLITPISRTISAKEKELLKITSEEKERLIKEETDYEEELERIKQEELRKEQERIQSRIDQLAAYNCAIDFSMVKGMTDEQFNERLNQARLDHEMEQKRIEEERIAAERAKLEEEERLAKQKAEQDAEASRLEAIRKEQEEKEAALVAEQERIRRQQEEEAAALRAEREKLEAEKREIEQAKLREEEEKKRAIELEASKKEAAEKALREAAAKAEEDRKRQLDIEAENNRIAALAPDKEKLTKWVHNINIGLTPDVGGSAHKIALEIHVLFGNFQKEALEKIALIK